MKSFRQCRLKLRRIGSKLQQHYPISNLDNQQDPTDEAIFILLTTQTNYAKFLASWQAIKNQFTHWNLILQTDAQSKLKELLKPAGLASQKARLITMMANKIASERGTVDLSFLRNVSTDVAEHYLINLPGFALKTARCVLMYSLQRQVFPLDIHCYRIMKRIGIIDNAMLYQSRKTHDYAQNCVYPAERYKLHVLMVQHGREMCRLNKPKCKKCPLLRSCHNKGELIRI